MLNELSAQIEFRELKETKIDLGGGLTLKTKYLNHSIFCMGYRFEYQGKSIVTAYDHEPFRNLFPTDPKDPGYNENNAKVGETAAKEENEKCIRFYRGADILVHDAQYVSKEMETHLGWGHSSYEIAINAAHRARAKKLIFFHHDPNRSDKELNFLIKKYENLMKGKSEVEIIIAKEGLAIEL